MDNSGSRGSPIGNVGVDEPGPGDRHCACHTEEHRPPEDGKQLHIFPQGSDGPEFL